jgi:hypothetical protein
MAIVNSGFFGGSDLAAATWTSPYAGPASSDTWVGEITFTNRSADVAHVSFAISTQVATPLNAEIELFQVALYPESAGVRIQKTVSFGQKVWVWSDIAGVNATVNGIESTNA